MNEKVLIIGAGHGLSTSIARLFAAKGMKVGLAARNIEKLAALADEIGASTSTCDASDPDAVVKLFKAFGTDIGCPDILVYNPSSRVRGPITEIDATATKDAILVSAYGAFLAAQQAAIRMLKAGSGTMLFTGASAGVKGYPRSASFAMGKFALRGLAQSMARELHPQGLHVGHFVIDGGIRNPSRSERVDAPAQPDSMLDPSSIAQCYWNFLQQDRSIWSWEIELRPWVEKF